MCSSDLDQLTLWAREAEKRPRRVLEDYESSALAEELGVEQEAEESEHRRQEEELDLQIVALASRAFI